MIGQPDQSIWSITCRHIVGLTCFCMAWHIGVGTSMILTLTVNVDAI